MASLRDFTNTTHLLLCAAASAFKAPVNTAAFKAPVNHRHVRTSSVRMCAPEQSVDAAEVSSLYASLNKRVSVLSSRRAPAMRERELLESLAKLWPANQKAQAGLWQHWYEEEGEAAGESLREAEGDAEALTKLIDG